MATTNQRDRAHPYLKGLPMILAVDTETRGLEWWAGGEPFIATTSDFSEDKVYQLMPHPEGGDFERDRKSLRKAILAADELVFHNAPFDLHALAHTGICSLDELLSKRIWDTHILAQVVMGEGNRVGAHKGGFKLKELAAHLLDADAGEPEDALRQAMHSLQLIRRVDQRDVGNDAYYQTWLVYRDLVEHYATNDTRLTYDLLPILLDKATGDHLKCYAIEQAVQPVLVRMEHRGIALDQTQVAALTEEYEAQKDRLTASLVDLNDGVEWNPNGDTDTLAFLESNGVTVTEKTPTGQPKTDKWILEKYKYLPAVATLLEWRAVDKLLGTYLGPMADRDVIRTSFWQVAAWTGRMSSSRPNLQNLPARTDLGLRLRSVFVPRPGYKLLVADYSSIELRLLAFYMADPAFKEIVENQDPFLWLGAMIYGTEDQDAWPVKRGPLKNGFYSMTYGAGGPKIAQTIGGGMTAAQGRELAKKIKEALGPRYTRLNARLRATVAERGWIRTLGNRIQRLDPDKSYVALNALIQGSAADIMKVGLVRAETALDVWGGYPLLVVHDEIVAEAPEDVADVALHDLQRAMASAADLDSTGSLRLETSGATCNNYSEGK